MSDTGSERPEETALEPEELARANLYGMVSRLFYTPADPKLLAEVSRSPAATEEEATGETEHGGLAGAWRNLREACRNAHSAIVRQEYDGLFVGVGKAAVTPYLSAYAEPNSPERYLVRLRKHLGAWGLARRDSVFEVEDHISGVSDVMRWLIESGHPLPEQRVFFEDFAYAGAVPFFAAVQKAPAASFYQHVASFASEFFELEKAAFEMDDSV